MVVAGLVAAFSLLTLGAGTARPERLADRFQSDISHLDTVKGRLNIRLAEVTLRQELWVRYPGFLRTETEDGPSAFSGTIVVLNDTEGWVYSSALNMATVVSRAEYSPALAGEAGTGSMLERIPHFLLHALRSSFPTNLVGREFIAGRSTDHIEIIVPLGNEVVPPGVFQVWVDNEFAYPLAWQDSSGREMRFESVSFNRTIDPAVFTFVPPPSASIRRVPPSQ